VLDGVATVTKKKIIMTKKPVLPVTATRPRPADGRAEKTAAGRNALIALIATCATRAAARLRQTCRATLEGNTAAD
jgi:hypothetical protein